MLITIGKNTEKRMKLLNIEEYPFSVSLLNKNFRELISIHHPDKGGDEEKAKVLIEAYGALKNLALDDITQKAVDIQSAAVAEQEKDIFAIFESCSRCNGIGEITISMPQTEICNHCNIYHHTFWLWAGIREARNSYCKSFKGTGKFKQKLGRVVNCYKCKGTGKINHCKYCNDTGIIKNEIKYKKEKCLYCKGIGKIEIKPFNPVIRKGAVMI